MIDFDKEEFLQRLDIRLHVIAAMIEWHEKYIVSTTIRDRSRSLDAQREIERMRQELCECISKLDKQVQEHFQSLKNELHGGEQ